MFSFSHNPSIKEIIPSFCSFTFKDMTENFYQSESAHHSQISYSGLPGEEKSSSFANNKKSRLK